LMLGRRRWKEIAKPAVLDGKNDTTCANVARGDC
jgi:hypothetical protein